MRLRPSDTESGSSILASYLARAAVALDAWSITGGAWRWHRRRSGTACGARVWLPASRPILLANNLEGAIEGPDVPGLRDRQTEGRAALSFARLASAAPPHGAL